MLILKFLLLFLIQGGIGWWGCHVWEQPYRNIAMLGLIGLVELLFLPAAGWTILRGIYIA